MHDYQSLQFQHKIVVLFAKLCLKSMFSRIRCGHKIAATCDCFKTIIICLDMALEFRGKGKLKSVSCMRLGFKIPKRVNLAPINTFHCLNLRLVHRLEDQIHHTHIALNVYPM
jgi:hypothetical protein